MKQQISTLSSVACASLLAALAMPLGAQAQTQEMPMHQLNFPQMTEQHAKLGFLVGDWNITGETNKNCPYGEGKFTAKEHNELLPGGLFVISRTKYSSLFKNSNQVSMFGVDPDTKSFTYDMFSSTGIKVHSVGALKEVDSVKMAGNTWAWTSEAQMKDRDTPMKTVYTMKMLSPTSYEFQVEGDGGLWMHGNATKINPPKTIQ